MFTWLKRLIHGTKPKITFIPGTNIVCVPFFYSDAMIARVREYIDQTDPFGKRAAKKRALEQQLEDAKWILEYEKKLDTLRKQTATQREEVGRSAGDTKRLKQLDAYLENLGRNLSLD